MARDDRRERACEQIEIELFEAIRAADVVRGIVGLELMQEPHAFLRERERWACPARCDSDARTRGVAAARELRSESRHGR